ncbi:PREDICTED: death domain-containing protein CRADD-like [Cyprinodon variegatus]|uniref:CASP2 and RIPK1 domain containing adaptor with death domain n=1 Tax=Cyprinodon variegatus TaxID=28743 RepID=A0A3Q2CMQ4_CYPVA|nr:PREDICTED: death domain-containing protein CRADD-like [Cyprinodon variegatus]
MDPAHRAVLRRFRVKLSDQLLVTDTILPFLFQEGILTEAQVQQVESQPTDKQKNLKLLDLLPNRGPRAFSVFLDALRDYSWIREQLELELRNTSGGGSPDDFAAPSCCHGDRCQLPDSVLQKVPSDQELSRLASRLGAEWEEVLLDLGVSAEALYRCRSDHILSSQAAALAGLVLWRRSEGKKATLARLLQSLETADIHPSVLEDAVMR